MSDTATPATPAIASRLGAEVLGTFWLVFGGCGTVIFAASSGFDFDRVAIALAFGLTVVTGAYAFGHISGAHFNPAVTIGLATAKRFDWKDVPAYVVAQVVGGTVAGAVLLVIAKGMDGFEADGNMATNAYGGDGYSLLAVLIAEVVLTAVFLYVILGATAKAATAGFAGLAIGLCLTLIHLIAIPIDGTSVNPARSLGVAWFGGGDALGDVWLFIVAPIAGAIIAGVTHALIVGEKD
ncbi:aquaporin Z [Nocardioides marmoriginsengisoli]|uniref:Aquaporin Z n=1 Tax=Nocardioides marmoriginsengisoli TaxID=661483 RepID=A0A3N0CHL9_9ACTN|nr:aquaporin Z [Nocardioides marmoriginsengisoli]RNL62954.1 aquaporin Z [Nocardioides marmoriginsengisoli]